MDPPWFTRNFLQSVLRSSRCDPSIILSRPCALEPGTTAGDSFSGALYRTKLHYRSGRDPTVELVTSWILKTESSAALNTDPALFDTERRLYCDVLPAMQKELEGFGESLDVPGLVYGSESSERLIVLEDLCHSGWSRRDELCTFEDALPAIRMLAKFHAASVVLNKKGMNLSNFANRTSDTLLTKFKPLFVSYVDAICSWDGFEAIRPKLQEFKTTIMDQYQRVYTPNPGPEGYNVLNHGDFHGKNLMHLLDDQQKVVKSAALDFQVCNWGSPAIDLVYFLYLVIHRDVLNNHREELLLDYHQHFAKSLTQMNFQGRIPTMQDLQAELSRNVFFELFHDALGTPFRTVDFSQTSLDDFLAGRVPDVGLNSARYCANVRENLTRLLLIPREK